MNPRKMALLQLLFVMSSNVKSGEALDSVNVNTTEPLLYPPVLMAVPAVSAAAVVTVGAVSYEVTVKSETAALGFPAASVSTPAANDITIAVPSAASHSSLYTVAEVAVQPVPLA